MFLKYQVTQEDIDRGRAKPETDNTAGITTTTEQHLLMVPPQHFHI